METSIDRLPGEPPCHAGRHPVDEHQAWLPALRRTLCRMFAEMACRLR